METTTSRVLGGRYRLGRLLGRGGMADVYAAVDERLGRPVAVKILRRPLLRNPEVRARFEQEARSAARLAHPNVVAVYDTGEDDGGPYLVMERLPGETLADRLAEARPDPDWVVRVAGDVLGALAAAHTAGIVHRDVKPGNILIDENGCAKVADFGIAKSAEAAVGDTTGTGMLLGTPAYLAPERIDGQAATPQSDLYSLGVVLYEALSGRKPFDGDTPVAVANNIRHTDPRPLTGVDPGLAAAVARAMAKDPARRFADAREMADALGCGMAGRSGGGYVEGDATTIMTTDDATTVVAAAPLASRRATEPVRRPVVSPWMLLSSAAVVLFILFLAMVGNRGTVDDGGFDRGAVAGRLRDLAGRVRVGDGPKGPELSGRLTQVASEVEAGGGSDSANRLLADVAAWHQQRLLYDKAAAETTSLLTQIPGVQPPAAAANPPPAPAPAPTQAPAQGKGKGGKKGKGDD